MIPRASFDFQNPQGLQMFPLAAEDHMVSLSSSVEVVNSASSSSSSHSSSLLFNLSVLKDKMSQVQTLVGAILSPPTDDGLSDHHSNSIALSSTLNSTIQEIIVTATSMMFSCQQMALTISSQGTTSCTNNELQCGDDHDNDQRLQHSNNTNYGNIGTDNNIRCQSFFSSAADESEALDWFSDSYNNNNNNNNNYNNCKLKDDDVSEANDSKGGLSLGGDEITIEGFGGGGGGLISSKNYDIIELDASDLLAKYTHYCQVCGKGFKRDANLRMHMRAHGDEYKTSAALSNPMKKKGIISLGTGDQGKDQFLMNMKPKKYSCPQEGCRFNKKHAKFQPLKSMICAKNHYKRTHCPKMYVCKKCNQKQFSVLSDLRTHEKHCGDLKWQCSCGTTFSRKDKLMGHVTLFVGHRPCVNGLSYSPKLEQQGLHLQTNVS